MSRDYLFTGTGSDVIVSGGTADTLVVTGPNPVKAGDVLTMAIQGEVDPAITNATLVRKWRFGNGNLVQNQHGETLTLTSAMCQLENGVERNIRGEITFTLNGSTTTMISDGFHCQSGN